MTTPSFHLKGTVGRSYRVGPEDTLRTKEALFELGYFKPPAYGLTEYPDEPLFTAIENFQRDQGLYRDGIMRPDGETATRLAQTLAAATRESTTVIENKLNATHEPRGRASQILLNRDLESPDPALGDAGGDDRVAMMRRRDNNILPSSPGDIVPPLIVGGGGAFLSQRRNQDQQRYEITDPPPPVPPSRRDDEERGYREELRPTEPPPINLTQPIPEDQPPGIYIHPIPDEELATLGQILESRRGNDLTKAELDRLRDYILGNTKGWVHIAGGRDATTGKDLPEYHIAGPGRRIAGNVHVGGHYTDLTFKTPSGRIIHIQSVDVDRHGKPTARELNIAEQIRRLHPEAYVILHPKAHQLDKLSRRKSRQPR